MRIDSSGKVGIGTTSPSAKLHIVGANASAPNLATSVTNAKVKIQNHNGSGLSSYQGYTGNSWYTQVANSNGTTAYGLSLNPYGGKVGIGTDSPACHLEVSGSGNGSVSDHLRITSTDTEAKLAFVTTTGNGAIYQNGYDLVFANNTANTERLRIDASGNLLVGHYFILMQLAVALVLGREMYII